MNTSDLRTRLKEETRQAHVDLEHALDLLSPRLEKRRYVQICRNFLNFHAAFENFLERRRRSDGSTAAEFYLENRKKTPWLMEDLKNLEASAEPERGEVERLERFFDERLPTENHLWGALYVIEGSTLGGQVLKRHFEGAFGLEPGRGTRYFSSYESQTGANWQSFLKELSALSPTPSEARFSIDAANDLFLLLKELHSTNEAAPSARL